MTMAATINDVNNENGNPKIEATHLLCLLKIAHNTQYNNNINSSITDIKIKPCFNV